VTRVGGKQRRHCIEATIRWGIDGSADLPQQSPAEATQPENPARPFRAGKAHCGVGSTSTRFIGPEPPMIASTAGGSRHPAADLYVEPPAFGGAGDINGSSRVAPEESSMWRAAAREGRLFGGTQDDLAAASARAQAANRAGEPSHCFTLKQPARRRTPRAVPRTGDFFHFAFGHGPPAIAGGRKTVTSSAVQAAASPPEIRRRPPASAGRAASSLGANYRRQAAIGGAPFSRGSAGSRQRFLPAGQRLDVGLLPAGGGSRNKKIK